MITIRLVLDPAGAAFGAHESIGREATHSVGEPAYHIISTRLLPAQTGRVPFSEADAGGGSRSSRTRSLARRPALTPPTATWCWQARPAKRQPVTAPGSGPQGYGQAEARELIPRRAALRGGHPAADRFVGFNGRTLARRTTPLKPCFHGHLHGRALRVHAMGVKNRYLALVAAGERPYGTFRARDKGLGVAQQLVRFTAGHRARQPSFRRTPLRGPGREPGRPRTKCWLYLGQRLPDVPGALSPRSGVRLGRQNRSRSA